MGRVVWEPFDRRTRTGLVFEVVLESVDSPWCSRWVADNQLGSSAIEDTTAYRAGAKAEADLYRSVFLR